MLTDKCLLAYQANPGVLVSLLLVLPRDLALSEVKDEVFQLGTCM
jgi:hypothetical protein